MAKDTNDRDSDAWSISKEQEEDIIRQHDYLEFEDEKTLTRMASLAHQQSITNLSETRAAHYNSTALDRFQTLQGLSPEDEVFDPSSDKFDLYKWIRLNTKMSAEDGIKTKRTGVAFRNVNIRGTGPALNIQATVGSLLTAPLRLGEIWSSRRKVPRHILKDFNGLVKSGELLVVLGRPGAGCSTLLKTLTGETYGLQADQDSIVHYNGIEQSQMMKEFKGEVIYNQEVDKHFPHLTVCCHHSSCESMRRANVTRLDKPSNTPPRCVCHKIVLSREVDRMQSSMLPKSLWQCECVHSVDSRHEHEPRLSLTRS